MKTIKLLVFILSAFLFSSCQSSYKILKAKQETGFKLSNYSTYGFYEIEAQGDTNSETFEKNIQVIKDALATNLKKRGLNEAQDPAIKINIALSVKEEIQTRQTNFLNDGYPRYMGQRRYTWKSEEVPVGKYREGTMLLDFVETENNKMVWEGGAKGILPDKEKKLSDKIGEAVAEIFTRIP
ncbi:DUF4136 domain-containing protein [Dyadobacter sp. CY312]|uniref:DUF4136 domain-containing protein n=1 Tax=Dyadobacter sp. CY312 TaxID=2907303 RepID=UPI001F300CEE|nr:DUF4136 domain-containing protein [Dyadobacter sp. CY312]MCE7041969.1 DUF4136 domain-containing protein [Dyadobacter sp. CY312]